MKQYYIISLKHTSRADSAITLWRKNSGGYCWYQDWAGLYNDSDRPGRSDGENVFVEKDIADKLFKMTVYGGEVRMVLPNAVNVWNELELSPKVMKAKKYATCFMSF